MSSLPPRPSVTGSPRDRDLVRLYWPSELRPAFDALFAIDDAMGEIVARATQPALAAIKLAWWRERLEDLDKSIVPAEPRLRAAAAELLPRGISGAQLAELEQAWALLLHTGDLDSFMQGIACRGPTLFKLAARLLDVPVDSVVENAANSFVTVDLGRRGIFDPAAQTLRRSKSGASRRARPLTALGALAYRDMKRGGPPFEPEGTPGRAWTLLRHRLTGRF